jgi:hypothetical protein
MYIAILTVLNACLLRAIDHKSPHILINFQLAFWQYYNDNIAASLLITR